MSAPYRRCRNERPFGPALPSSPRPDQRHRVQCHRNVRTSRRRGVLPRAEGPRPILDLVAPICEARLMPAFRYVALALMLGTLVSTMYTSPVQAARFRSCSQTVLVGATEAVQIRAQVNLQCRNARTVIRSYMRRGFPLETFGQGWKCVQVNSRGRKQCRKNGRLLLSFNLRNSYDPE